MPAAIYIETHGGTGTGGSDDHAGVDIGRTFTETPPAATPEQFLRHVREGRAEARGEQGSAAKWAHAAMALATRALLLKDAASANGRTAHDAGAVREARRDPEAALKMAERVMSEGNVRSGSVAGDLGPEDARALLGAFTDSIGLDLSGRALIEHMQSDDFSHAELERRARRAHERKLREAVENTVARLDGDGAEPADLAAARDRDGPRAVRGRRSRRSPTRRRPPSWARRRQKLTPGDGPKRVALIADAIGGVHGVTHTIERIRDLGVPGYEVEVVGTDRNVDRRLPAAAEVEVPFYAGLEIGVPSLPGMVEVLAEGRFDLVHVTAPGPAGVIATLIARIMELPRAGQLAHRAGRLRRAPLLVQASSRRRWTPRSRSSTASAGGCCRPAPPATSRWPGSASSATDRALGPRGRHLALRPGPARPGRLPRRDQGALRRAA